MKRKQSRWRESTKSVSANGKWNCPSLRVGVFSCPNSVRRGTAGRTTHLHHLTVDRNHGIIKFLIAIRCNELHVGSRPARDVPAPRLPEYLKVKTHEVKPLHKLGDVVP